MSVITLTGPTCAGKSTIEAHLAILGVGRTISHTTRAPRLGEQDGVSYHFINPDEFIQANCSGDFIETVEFAGVHYGLAAREMAMRLREYRHVAVVCEPVGAEQILAWCSSHGVPHLAVSVDCHPQVQAMRFMERMLGDVVAAGPRMGAQIAAHTRRLSEMLSTEVRWRQSAAMGSVNGRHAYGLTVDTTTTNPASLAELILSRAENVARVGTPG